MAIGIRRDRGGVMPGTVSHPSAVATAVVKGDLVKLSSGLLVNCDDGDALSEDQIFLALTNYVANVTHVAATNVDLLVMPITDLLTFIGPIHLIRPTNILTDWVPMAVSIMPKWN